MEGFWISAGITLSSLALVAVAGGVLIKAIEAWTTVAFARLEIKRRQAELDDRWLTLEEKKQSTDSDDKYGSSMN